MRFVKVTYLNTVHQNLIDEIITSGEVFKSKSGNEFIIVCYDSSFNVRIRFIKTGYEKSYELSQIRKGLVKELVILGQSSKVVLINIMLSLMGLVIS